MGTQPSSHEEAMVNDNVRFALGGTGVRIIDQRQLPNRLEHLTLSTPQECFDAIATLAVRGAPAIGIFCAHALAVLVPQLPAQDFPQLQAGARELADYLVSSRPTAVNLHWAAERMMRVVDAHAPGGQGEGGTVADASSAGVAAADAWPQVRERLYRSLRAEALAIRAEDAAACKAMAEHGLSLLEDGDGVVPHCNAGPLVSSQYGTALEPLILGTERDMTFHVFADETRPLLQGARLTAYELHQAGVDVTVMCDNMASVVMGQGRVQACIVGADRVAANGDVANKVGTNGLAIVAAHYGVPFYVVCPTSTIDPACATGADIPIELRDPDEVGLKYFAEPVVPEGVSCFNPSFDVTDHSLVTAIVTEQGIFRAPYSFDDE